MWRYSSSLRESVEIVDTREAWGRITHRVLVPSTGSVTWLPVADLLETAGRMWSEEELAWRAASAFGLHLMALGEISTLARSDLEPLPHQLEVVQRALGLDPVRLLLADEVGLGKTIEAGLIVSELRARGRIKRVLIVAPKGMQLQWVSEMWMHFHEELARVGAGGIPVDAGINPWKAFDFVICSLDSVKPLRQRAGWSPERIEEHNRIRFDAIVGAGWDLVIFDEAHHVAGSSEDVARHGFARELATRVPHVLLLSATPHSGKSDAFSRLLGLLDSGFWHGKGLSRESVAPLVVRTEKREAVDSAGRPLFVPRTTRLDSVPYGSRAVEQTLYGAVTEYVREGYGRAKREKRPAIGFLVLLMQRLMSSSTAAIAAALEKRSAALIAEGTQLALFAEGSERWGELTGEEQVEALAAAKGTAWGNEKAEVDILLELARRAMAAGPDAKALYLLDLVRNLRREESDPSLKVVIFTEFVATQEMLLQMFKQVGIKTVAISGSMNVEDRATAQEAFANDAGVLVSTDAGGEGINLQFAHIVINYDLPWNPMRIEQRIGRVDRIGQRAPVRAFNLVMENSVDERVLEVLERKLWVILAELGVDKSGDVLESASSGVEDLYINAVMAPESLEGKAEELAATTKEDIASASTLREMLRSPMPARKGASTEAGEWLRRAADAYSNWTGESPAAPSTVIAHQREMAPGECLPVVAGEVPGLWSLWEVRPSSSSSKKDCFALFVSEDGTVRPDQADRLWREISNGLPLRGAQPLDPSEEAKLRSAGADHAYGTCAALAPPETWSDPVLTLRLAVVVTT